MAKGFKFPAPKGFAKGGMCSPKGAKRYAKGGPARGTNIEASDLYSDSDLESVEAGRNMPRATKNPMRSESTQYAKAVDRFDRANRYEQSPGNENNKQLQQRMARNKANLDDYIPARMEKMRAEDETGGYAKGGKVTMKKAKAGNKYMKMKTAYADGGEVETEQTASKSTKVKMPRGGKAPMARPKAVPAAGRTPMIAPQQPAPMVGGMAAPSPLSRVARPMGGTPRMGMKMGGKAKKC